MLKYLFTLLLCSLIVNAQDYENPQDPPIVPPINELKEMRREKIKSVLASVLLERYLECFDDWGRNGGFAKAHIYQDYNAEYNKEVWYALVIRKDIEEPIWIKFCIYKTYEKHELNFALSNQLVNMHIARTREGLKAALEQTFIINLDNEDVRRSMIYGEAHIYQLATKDSDIAKIKKEDLVQ